MFTDITLFKFVLNTNSLYLLPTLYTYILYKLIQKMFYIYGDYWKRHKDLKVISIAYAFDFWCPVLLVEQRLLEKYTTQHTFRSTMCPRIHTRRL